MKVSCKQKNYLRSKQWSTEMDKITGKEMNGCHSCPIVGKNVPPEELRNTPLPDKA